MLIRIAPLAASVSVKTSLLINELTCRIGNTILLVMICRLFAIRAHDSIGGNRFCVRSPACACACITLRYLMVTVKIRALVSNVPVALAGSLIWWDSL